MLELVKNFLEINLFLVIAPTILVFTIFFAFDNAKRFSTNKNIFIFILFYGLIFTASQNISSLAGTTYYWYILGFFAQIVPVIIFAKFYKKLIASPILASILVFILCIFFSFCIKFFLRFFIV